METNSKAIIKCNDLVKLYKQGEKTIYAVNNCNISVRQGEFAAVIGKSGSGKSTLLSLMAGFISPTHGSVLINGRNLGEMNDDEISKFRSCEMGFIFQSYCLFPVLTAKENILFALSNSSGFSNSYFSELCEKLDITDRLDHLPAELSGGQQQRVAIARALINRPKILLADEPTGNLDKESSEAMIEYFERIHNDYGTTIVVVTHDMDIAERADTIYEVENGVVHLK